MIPKSPPRRYATSKQLIGGDDFNNLNDQLFSSQTLTATGVTQADAAQGNAANIEVLSGSANNAGIILPAAYPGISVNILNNSLNTTLVYGQGKDVVQNAATGYAAANASVSMATLTSYNFSCFKTGFWQRGQTG